MPCRGALDISPQPSHSDPPQAAEGAFEPDGVRCEACAAPLSPRQCSPRHRRVTTGALGIWLARGTPVRASSGPPDDPPRAPWVGRAGRAKSAENGPMGTFGPEYGL